MAWIRPAQAGLFYPEAPMATTAKTRNKLVASIAISPNHPPTPAAPKRADSKVVHAMLDELFVALKPFGACESAKIVSIFHRLKTAT